MLVLFYSERLWQRERPRVSAQFCRHHNRRQTETTKQKVAAASGNELLSVLENDWLFDLLCFFFFNQQFSATTNLTIH